ncbi:MULTISPECIES: hypothetical protein [Psychrobacter]|uniref:Uncharacterized protein n=1 Tax=Psychrobacter alimentarius TaxID=261164 RepID=A0ABM5ZYL9_9GAMM|nr:MULTISPECIES: hypothetical protein [Psychrobacter]AMT97237.1 hypothetical protein A3K91_1636 [Psychrobacter alimentarius]QCB30438.1 hypothetical protein E5677_05205 [Psychrobacter sp. PAMC27889]
MTVDSIFKNKQTLKNDIKKECNDELQIEPIPLATLYRPQADSYHLSEVGFIVIEDGWDEQSLLNLQQQVGCTLFALQTTDKHIDRFEVIDGIIVCKADEVGQIKTVFESVLSDRDKVGIDVNDIKKSCGAEKPANFIQARATDIPDSEQIKSTVNHLLNQIPEGLSTQYMMLDIESDHKLSLDEFFSVTTAVESRIADDSKVFYGNRMIDKPDHYWMGAIYVAS